MPLIKTITVLFASMFFALFAVSFLSVSTVSASDAPTEISESETLTENEETDNTNPKWMKVLLLTLILVLGASLIALVIAYTVLQWKRIDRVYSTE